MRKLLLSLFAILCPLLAGAQVSFGYFSYDTVLKAMHGYDMVQKNLEDLQSQYDAELKRAEDDFNKKYEEFLEGQRDFAPTILQKRQTELQELMMRNIAFKEQATEEALSPLRAKLSEALTLIGEEEGYAFILNTDGNTVPYLNTQMGIDVTERLMELLR